MINVHSSILKIVCTLLLVLGVSVVQAANHQLTIIYSGNLDGELEPCGCSIEGDLGGILRRATTLKKLRDEQPDLFLFSAGGLIASVSPQDRLTGEYILKGFATLDYDAIALQWPDLAYGEQFINNDQLPWVATNWAGDSYFKSRLIERGGNKLAFYTWLDPEQAPQSSMQGEHQQATNNLIGLERTLQESRKAGFLTVLSTTYSLEKAKASLPLSVVDLLIIESAYEEFGEPQRLGETLVIQPGSRGMRIARLDINLNKQGRIAEFKHQVIPMPSSIADAAWLLPWYDEYNNKVKQNYKELVALRKAMASGESPYAGEEVCQVCHADEHDIWSNSLHSGAFGKLENVNKAFDPACIICHTVGFGKEGGFIDIDATPQLLNVQCESCHGASRAHAKSAGIKATENSTWQPQQICAQCHIQKHSPSFDFNNYWPRIKHGAVK